jgi:peptidoglycan/xylan/chitin deacetylase (PgdA/CDA1 family)
MKSKIVGLFAILIITVTSTPLVSSNAQVGWNVTGSGNDVFSYEFKNGILKIDVTAANEKITWLSQNSYSVEPGNICRFSYDVIRSANTSAVCFANDGTPIVDTSTLTCFETNLTTQTWRQESVTFKVPVGVTAIKVGGYTASNGQVMLKNARVERIQCKGKPLVTFRFDDGHKSTKEVAQPILDRYGYVGVSAVVSKAVQVALPGYMNINDVKSLYAHGWEIASHSYNHTHTVDDYQANVSKEYLRSNGISTTTFVYPYGAWDYASEDLCKKYYQILSTSDSYPNYPPYDFTRINVKILNSNTSADQVAKWLNQTDDGEWVVFLIHDVADGSTDFGTITPHTLDEVCKAVNARGFDVVTFKDVYLKYFESSFDRIRIDWVQKLSNNAERAQLIN